ncbi:DUF2721 domain-containing protein [Leptothermofonsia sp. ETS-13]|uniref:DUF2721 domain-containing protein n=1 Tax=Leptothermofonsia sp. ETS-13 TaxID=3035696 RepID=UPI003B9E6AE5
MSVEQTTQLIQLILNSVLLTIACALALGRLGIRQATVEEHLKAASRHYSDLLDLKGEMEESSRILSLRRLSQTKKVLRQLQQRYQVLYQSLLATHYAFLFAVISTFMMTLRALVNADWLITLAIGLFVISVSVLLLGVGLTLVEVHHSKLPLWQEVEGMLNLDKPSRFSSQARMPKAVSRRARYVPSESQPPARVRVG